MSDPDARMDRLRRAARYRFAQQVEQEERSGTVPVRRSLDPDEVRAERRLQGARDLAAAAADRIAEAEDRGFFEGNRYHGKPLPDNDGQHDPDWWIRRYVEREELTGLGPPALSLRKEDAQLDDRLDEETAEQRVREIVQDFDDRIVEARRQLLGGPPVVTALRDVEVEVARWRDRLEARRADQRRAAAAEEAAQAGERRQRRRWWRRR